MLCNSREVIILRFTIVDAILPLPGSSISSLPFDPFLCTQFFFFIIFPSFPADCSAPNLFHAHSNERFAKEYFAITISGHKNPIKLRQFTEWNGPKSYHLLQWLLLHRPGVLNWLTRLVAIKLNFNVSTKNCVTRMWLGCRSQYVNAKEAVYFQYNASSCDFLLGAV